MENESIDEMIHQQKLFIEMLRKIWSEYKNDIYIIKLKKKKRLQKKKINKEKAENPEKE